MWRRRVSILVLMTLMLGCASKLSRDIDKADELRGTKAYDAALRAYVAIVLDHAKEPKVAEVLLRIADLQRFNLGQDEQSRATYRRVIDDWPRQPVTMIVYRRLADMSIDVSDYVGAIESLEGLLRFFPSHPEGPQLRHEIGTLYLRLRNYPQARIEFQGLLASQTLSAELRAQVLFDIGESYLLEGKATASIPYYHQVATEYPDSPLASRALEQKADAQADRGEMGMSRQLLEELRAQRLRSHGSLPGGEARATILLHPHGRPAVRVVAELAITEAERAQGLMHRTALAEGEGMWFVFPQMTQTSFWMKDTPLSLDMIFIDGDFFIVDVIANTKPLSEDRLTPSRPYRYVLEVPAGFAERHQLSAGVRVHWASAKQVP